MIELKKIKNDFKLAIIEFLAITNLKKNSILVIGCSTSEIQGEKIGTATAPEIANELLEIVIPIIKKNEIFLAVQCCEHLNRALVVNEKCAEKYNLPRVEVIPCPEAGGSLSSAYYNFLERPIMVETIQADAGIDIGDTFIGMHLKSVTIPIRFSIKKIGYAHLTSAKTRSKLIGGERAKYK